ncbi:hypothetical protein [Streptomyces sp. I05A-00742]|uniref:hypothetical protein n=1 Tax=Streptomyces sp. I05A-00742 TaxID=2732853 RepID=UPI00148A094B|nr:hypothetical protein [Streptomyces sp. I05A-00742]
MATTGRKTLWRAGAVLGSLALATGATAATATADTSHTSAQVATMGSTTGLQYWVNCEPGSDSTGSNPVISTVHTGTRTVMGSARQGNTTVLEFVYSYVQLVVSPNGRPTRVQHDEKLTCGKSERTGNILFHTRDGKIVNP